MRLTWRWFGPEDPISIADITQTGASGIVTALHHLPPGCAWPVSDIMVRRQQVERPGGIPSGLTWDVVESVPVSEAIKCQGPLARQHMEAYKETLVNLASCGVQTVCYNFMPVLDWTRTELRHRLPNGGQGLRFDLVDFALFDCFVLKRSDARSDYSAEIYEQAERRHENATLQDCKTLSDTIVAGLPGANNNWTLVDVKSVLQTYAGLTPDILRSHMVDFLSEIIPTAEKLGLRLCCHPDDPPFSLLGLPRVMTSLDDYAQVMSAVDSPANGITFCTGSLGVSASFDPIAFIRSLGARIHFAHLRNVTRTAPSDRDKSSFDEAEHLTGDVDMVPTVRALLDEEQRRRSAGRSDREIPMRPDHGHTLLSDKDRPFRPGYPLIGRLRGLAELRGVIAACGAEQK